ncbi:hypothetical protein EYS14_15065 [Alteromonadaceae bacterium M269]|nr:hypothetical protein EYS14_15065 [Alteromonadaceae bacterium M269]
MKVLVINFLTVIIGYIVFSLVNMGTVLLIYHSLAIDTQNHVAALAIAIIVIAPTSYGLFRLVVSLSKEWKLVVSGVLWFLLMVITALNIYLNQSIEPLAYKVMYLVVVTVSLVILKPWNRVREKGSDRTDTNASI